jgi:hypothetical protein
MDATPLEAALIQEFHWLYADSGFPRPESLRVVGRENTGAGRYVALACECDSVMPDGYLDLAGGFVEIDAVPDGLMAIVRIEAGRPVEIEIAVYGEEHWDGVEGTWTITRKPKLSRPAN